MSFIYPSALFLLIFLIPLFLMILKSNSQDIEKVFSKKVLQRVLVTKNGFIKKKSRNIIFLWALFFMIIALARPVVFEDSKESKKIEGYNLVIALDISKSMQAEDVFPSRLLYAKQTIYELLEKIPEAKVAIIAFSGDAFLVSPFSEDFKSIQFLVKHLKPDYLSSKGSSLVSALNASDKIFKINKESNPNVLILTDGVDGKEIQSSIKFANQNDIKVHIINIGTKKGAAIKIGSELLKDADGNIVISKRDDKIAQLAQKSGGGFISISSFSSSVDNIINDIRNKSIKTEQNKEVLQGVKELFIYPLFISIILLFISFNSLRFFVLLLFICTSNDAYAGLFDFVHIKNAKENYKEKKYDTAAHGFSKIDNNEARYNEANALYKAKKYKQALQKYESLNNLPKEQEYKRLHNLGNTQVNLQRFDKAIKSYEKALEIKEDEDTRYNLELLKKQQKNRQQDKNQKNNNEKKSEKKDKKHKENSSKQEEKQDDNKQKESNKSKQIQKEQKIKKDKNSKSKSEEKQHARKEVEQKPMSDNEAKKWEKRMQQKDFKTQPYLMHKNKRGSSEVAW